MDLLSGYGSDADDLPASRVPDIAPAVDTTGLALVAHTGLPGTGAVVPVAATKSLHGACAPTVGVQCVRTS